MTAPVCLRAERRCGCCHAAELYRADARILSHGKRGYWNGCNCQTCAAWYQRHLRAQRTRRRREAINNRGTINVLRNGL